MLVLICLHFSFQSGVEYYFGYNYPDSDLTLQDFRSRDLMWDQNRHALEFFSRNKIPFWNMTNANYRLSGNNWCLANTNGESIVVYLRDGGSDIIDLSDTNSSYLVEWFDPRNGGGLQLGTKHSLPPKSSQSLGEAPEYLERDWVVLLRRCIDCTPDEDDSNAGLISGSVVAGLVMVAIVLVVVLKIRQRHSVSSGLKTSDLPSEDNSRGQDPPTTSSNDSAILTESRTSYRHGHATVIEKAIPLREEQGPHYKDQVAPDVQSDFTPNVANMRATGGSTAEETEITPVFFRVEL